MKWYEKYDRYAADSKNIGFSDFVINGIDRENNNIGYTFSNCVTCCKFCNRAKSTFKKEDFLKWVENIKKNRNV